jgi:hypothetical protein
MNRRRSLAVVLGSALAGAVALLTPHITHAEGWQLFSLTDIGFQVFQYIAYGVSYLISIIGFLIFSIEVFFLQFIIDLNYDIVNSVSVQFGFSIVLAFANILFVAAIIIMAVATIVRYNTYGARQILLKIVIAAIGVNFSLILAGTVVNFADQGAKFFMNGAVPNAASDTGTSAFGTDGFVSNLAGAFNPQRMMIQNGISTSSDSLAQAKAKLDGATSAVGGVYAAIAGIFMTAAMVILLAVFFGVLVAAFVARYIMLSLLLTIMPVVWLAWIFPFGKPLVSYWTDKFVKWTFFSPMAMFFLYLSMKSVSFLNSAHIVGNANITSLAAGQKHSGVSGLLYDTFKDLAQPLITNALNFTLVAGTLYGGLYFSSKLGIKAAGVGAKAFESMGNSVKRRAITAAKDRGLSTWDRVRTAGKDENGNSLLTRGASRVATGGGRAGNILRGTLKGLGVPVSGLTGAVANAGKLDPKDKDYKARIKREKEALAGYDNEALHKLRERTASQSLLASPEKEAAIFELLKDRKQLGAISERIEKQKKVDGMTIEEKLADDKKKGISHSTSILPEQQERDNREYYEKQLPDAEKNLEQQLKRAAASGALGDITSAAPQLAAFAPPAKRKGGEPGEMQTPEEMVASAIAGLKRDDAPSVAFDFNLFGSLDPDKGPTLAQVRNVMALNAQTFNEISLLNAEQAEIIAKTAKFLENPPREWVHQPEVRDASGKVTQKEEKKIWAPMTVRTRAMSLLKLHEKGPNSSYEKAAKAAEAADDGGAASSPGIDGKGNPV